MTAEDAKTYLAEKEIPQLMESLITGLMYHRPDDPVLFLEDCLVKVRNVGIDKVKWNSFIDESKKLAYIKTEENVEGNEIEEKGKEDEQSDEEEKTDEAKEAEESEEGGKADEDEKAEDEKTEEEKTEEAAEEEEKTEDDKKDEPEEEEAEDKVETENDEIDTQENVDNEESGPDVDKSHPQVIVLMGPPGSGKNIQLLKIAEKYKEFECISVGNLLRTQLEEHFNVEKWQEIKNVINSGQMADQSAVRKVILKEMETKPSDYYVIDGNPRSVNQADEFGKYIGKIVVVFLLDCSEEYCRQRLLQKREIESRGDDTDEAINERMQHFKDVTLPMLKRYDDLQMLHYINGEKEEDEVFQEICKIIEKNIKLIEDNVANEESEQSESADGDVDTNTD